MSEPILPDPENLRDEADAWDAQAGRLDALSRSLDILPYNWSGNAKSAAVRAALTLQDSNREISNAASAWANQLRYIANKTEERLKEFRKQFLEALLSGILFFIFLPFDFILLPSMITTMATIIATRLSTLAAALGQAFIEFLVGFVVYGIETFVIDMGSQGIGSLGSGAPFRVTPWDALSVGLGGLLGGLFSLNWKALRAELRQPDTSVKNVPPLPSNITTGTKSQPGTHRSPTPDNGPGLHITDLTPTNLKANSDLSAVGRHIEDGPGAVPVPPPAISSSAVNPRTAANVVPGKIEAFGGSPGAAKPVPNVAHSDAPAPHVPSTSPVDVGGPNVLKPLPREPESLRPLHVEPSSPDASPAAPRPVQPPRSEPANPQAHLEAGNSGAPRPGMEGRGGEPPASPAASRGNPPPQPHSGPGGLPEPGAVKRLLNDLPPVKTDFQPPGRLPQTPHEVGDLHKTVTAPTHAGPHPVAGGHTPSHPASPELRPGTPEPGRSGPPLHSDPLSGTERAVAGGTSGHRNTGTPAASVRPPEAPHPADVPRAPDGTTRSAPPGADPSDARIAHAQLEAAAKGNTARNDGYRIVESSTERHHLGDGPEQLRNWRSDARSELWRDYWPTVKAAAYRQLMPPDYRAEHAAFSSRVMERFVDNFTAHAGLAQHVDEIRRIVRTQFRDLGPGALPGALGEAAEYLGRKAGLREDLVVDIAERFKGRDPAQMTKAADDFRLALRQHRAGDPDVVARLHSQPLGDRSLTLAEGRALHGGDERAARRWAKEQDREFGALKENFSRYVVREAELANAGTHSPKFTSVGEVNAKYTAGLKSAEQAQSLWRNAAGEYAKAERHAAALARESRFGGEQRLFSLESLSPEEAARFRAQHGAGVKALFESTMGRAIAAGAKPGGARFQIAESDFAEGLRNLRRQTVADGFAHHEMNRLREHLETAYEDAATRGVSEADRLAATQRVHEMVRIAVGDLLHGKASAAQRSRPLDVANLRAWNKLEVKMVDEIHRNFSDAAIAENRALSSKGFGKPAADAATDRGTTRTIATAADGRAVEEFMRLSPRSLAFVPDETLVQLGTAYLRERHAVEGTQPLADPVMTDLVRQAHGPHSLTPERARIDVLVRGHLRSAGFHVTEVKSGTVVHASRYQAAEDRDLVAAAADLAELPGRRRIVFGLGMDPEASLAVLSPAARPHTVVHAPYLKPGEHAGLSERTGMTVTTAGHPDPVLAAASRVLPIDAAGRVTLPHLAVEWHFRASEPPGKATPSTLEKFAGRTAHPLPDGWTVEFHRWGVWFRPPDVPIETAFQIRTGSYAHRGELLVGVGGHATPASVAAEVRALVKQLPAGDVDRIAWLGERPASVKTEFLTGTGAGETAAGMRNRRFGEQLDLGAVHRMIQQRARDEADLVQAGLSTTDAGRWDDGFEAVKDTFVADVKAAAERFLGTSTWHEAFDAAGFRRTYDRLHESLAQRLEARALWDSEAHGARERADRMFATHPEMSRRVDLFGVRGVEPVRAEFWERFETFAVKSLDRVAAGEDPEVVPGRTLTAPEQVRLRLDNLLDTHPAAPGGLAARVDRYLESLDASEYGRRAADAVTSAGGQSVREAVLQELRSTARQIVRAEHEALFGPDGELSMERLSPDTPVSRTWAERVDELLATDRMILAEKDIRTAYEWLARRDPGFEIAVAKATQDVGENPWRPAGDQAKGRESLFPTTEEIEAKLKKAKDTATAAAAGATAHTKLSLTVTIGERLDQAVARRHEARLVEGLTPDLDGARLDKLRQSLLDRVENRVRETFSDPFDDETGLPRTPSTSEEAARAGDFRSFLDELTGDRLQRELDDIARAEAVEAAGDDLFARLDLMAPAPYLRDASWHLLEAHIAIDLKRVYDEVFHSVGRGEVPEAELRKQWKSRVDDLDADRQLHVDATEAAYSRLRDGAVEFQKIEAEAWERAKDFQRPEYVAEVRDAHRAEYFAAHDGSLSRETDRRAWLDQEKALGDEYGRFLSERQWQTMQDTLRRRLGEDFEAAIDRLGDLTTSERVEAGLAALTVQERFLVSVREIAKTTRADSDGLAAVQRQQTALSQGADVHLAAERLNSRIAAAVDQAVADRTPSRFPADQRNAVRSYAAGLKAHITGELRTQIASRPPHTLGAAELRDLLSRIWRDVIDVAPRVEQQLVEAARPVAAAVRQRAGDLLIELEPAIPATQGLTAARQRLVREFDAALFGRQMTVPEPVRTDAMDEAAVTIVRERMLDDLASSYAKQNFDRVEWDAEVKRMLGQDNLNRSITLVTRRMHADLALHGRLADDVDSQLDQLQLNGTSRDDLSQAGTAFKTAVRDMFRSTYPQSPTSSDHAAWEKRYADAVESLDSWVSVYLVGARVEELAKAVNLGEKVRDVVETVIGDRLARAENRLLPHSVGLDEQKRLASVLAAKLSAGNPDSALVRLGRDVERSIERHPVAARAGAGLDGHRKDLRTRVEHGVNEAMRGRPASSKTDRVTEAVVSKALATVDERPVLDWIVDQSALKAHIDSLVESTNLQGSALRVARRLDALDALEGQLHRDVDAQLSQLRGNRTSDPDPAMAGEAFKAAIREMFSTKYPAEPSSLDHQVWTERYADAIASFDSWVSMYLVTARAEQLAASRLTSPEDLAIVEAVIAKVVRDRLVRMDNHLMSAGSSRHAGSTSPPFSVGPAEQVRLAKELAAALSDGRPNPAFAAVGADLVRSIANRPVAARAGAGMEAVRADLRQRAHDTARKAMASNPADAVTKTSATDAFIRKMVDIVDERPMLDWLLDRSAVEKQITTELAGARTAFDLGVRLKLTSSAGSTTGGAGVRVWHHADPDDEQAASDLSRSAADTLTDQPPAVRTKLAELGIKVRSALDGALAKLGEHGRSSEFRRAANDFSEYARQTLEGHVRFREAEQLDQSYEDLITNLDGWLTVKVAGWRARDYVASTFDRDWGNRVEDPMGRAAVRLTLTGSVDRVIDLYLRLGQLRAPSLGASEQRRLFAEIGRELVADVARMPATYRSGLMLSMAAAMRDGLVKNPVPAVSPVLVDHNAGAVGERVALREFIRVIAAVDSSDGRAVDAFVDAELARFDEAYAADWNFDRAAWREVLEVRLAGRDRWFLSYRERERVLAGVPRRAGMALTRLAVDEDLEDAAQAAVNAFVEAVAQRIQPSHTFRSGDEQQWRETVDSMMTLRDSWISVHLLGHRLRRDIGRVLTERLRPGQVSPAVIVRAVDAELEKRVARHLDLSSSFRLWPDLGQADLANLAGFLTTGLAESARLKLADEGRELAVRSIRRAAEESVLSLRSAPVPVASIRGLSSRAAVELRLTDVLGDSSGDKAMREDVVAEFDRRRERWWEMTGDTWERILQERLDDQVEWVASYNRRAAVLAETRVKIADTIASGTAGQDVDRLNAAVVKLFHELYGRDGGGTRFTESDAGSWTRRLDRILGSADAWIAVSRVGDRVRDRIGVVAPELSAKVRGRLSRMVDFVLESYLDLKRPVVLPVPGVEDQEKLVRLVVSGLATVSTVGLNHDELEADLLRSIVEDPLPVAAGAGVGAERARLIERVEAGRVPALAGLEGPLLQVGVRAAAVLGERLGKKLDERHAGAWDFDREAWSRFVGDELAGFGDWVAMHVRVYQVRGEVGDSERREAEGAFRDMLVAKFDEHRADGRQATESGESRRVRPWAVVLEEHLATGDDWLAGHARRLRARHEHAQRIDRRLSDAIKRLGVDEHAGVRAIETAKQALLAKFDLASTAPELSETVEPYVLDPLMRNELTGLVDDAVDGYRTIWVRQSVAEWELDQLTELGRRLQRDIARSFLRSPGVRLDVEGRAGEILQELGRTAKWTGDAEISVGVRAAFADLRRKLTDAANNAAARQRSMTPGPAYAGPAAKPAKTAEPAEPETATTKQTVTPPLSHLRPDFTADFAELVTDRTVDAELAPFAAQLAAQFEARAVAEFDWVTTGFRGSSGEYRDAVWKDLYRNILDEFGTKFRSRADFDQRVSQMQKADPGVPPEWIRQNPALARKMRSEWRSRVRRLVAQSIGSPPASLGHAARVFENQYPDLVREMSNRLAEAAADHARRMRALSRFNEEASERIRLDGTARKAAQEAYVNHVAGQRPRPADTEAEEALRHSLDAAAVFSAFLIDLPPDTPRSVLADARTVLGAMRGRLTEPGASVLLERQLTAIGREVRGRRDVDLGLADALAGILVSRDTAMTGLPPEEAESIFRFLADRVAAGEAPVLQQVRTVAAAYRYNAGRIDQAIRQEDDRLHALIDTWLANPALSLLSTSPEGRALLREPTMDRLRSALMNPDAVLRPGVLRALPEVLSHLPGLDAHRTQLTDLLAGMAQVAEVGDEAVGKALRNAKDILGESGYGVEARIREAIGAPVAKALALTHRARFAPSPTQRILDDLAFWIDDEITAWHLRGDLSVATDADLANRWAEATRDLEATYAGRLRDGVVSAPPGGAAPASESAESADDPPEVVELVLAIAGRTRQRIESDLSRPDRDVAEATHRLIVAEIDAVLKTAVERTLAGMRRAEFSDLAITTGVESLEHTAAALSDSVPLRILQDAQLGTEAARAARSFARLVDRSGDEDDTELREETRQPLAASFIEDWLTRHDMTFGRSGEWITGVRGAGSVHTERLRELARTASGTEARGIEPESAEEVPAEQWEGQLADAGLPEVAQRFFDQPGPHLRSRLLIDLVGTADVRALAILSRMADHLPAPDAVDRATGWALDMVHRAAAGRPIATERAPGWLKNDLPVLIKGKLMEGVLERARIGGATGDVLTRLAYLIMDC